jgi:hypothetical protein
MVTEMACRTIVSRRTHMTTSNPVHQRNGAVDTWTSNSARAHRAGDNTWG